MRERFAITSHFERKHRTALEEGQMLKRAAPAMCARREHAT
jgi:hypothetical protein